MPAIQECKRLFDKAYAPLHETYDEDLPDEDDTSTPVPRDLKSFVKTRTTLLRARLRHNHVTYTRSSTHVGNSLIYFYPNGDRTSPPQPGCIEHIFSLDGRMVFAMRRQLPLRDGAVDPFRHYPHFPARLHSAKLATGLEVVKVDEVMCHFARYRISLEDVVVLSLSKVCISVPSFSSQLNRRIGLVVCYNLSGGRITGQ